MRNDKKQVNYMQNRNTIKILIAFLFLCNAALLIVADGWLWKYSSTQGFFGLLGLITFFIAYAASIEMSLSLRDFFCQSQFGIFLKKLKYANGTALSVWVSSIVISAVCGNKSTWEFIHWLNF